MTFISKEMTHESILFGKRHRVENRTFTLRRKKLASAVMQLFAQL